MPVEDSVPPVNARRALGDALASFRKCALELELQRQLARRVDGHIIGTGQADYTQGNTLYRLTVAGKPFQLIDVPGIEGDESRYRHLVEEAVAKAHLVFFVNGTNKKPEAATTRRIHGYLRRNTRVVPVVNVRGHADSYEYEMDRISLAAREESAAALLQTCSVLRDALGADVVLPGYSVQGNVAFSALAIDPASGMTTICPGRSDLVRVQRAYLDVFGSATDMLRFSEVQALVEFLGARAVNYREDIIESIKGQVLALVVETEGSLTTQRELHALFMASVEAHFVACAGHVTQARDDVLRDAAEKRRQLWNGLWLGLTDAVDNIVEADFGDQVAIKRELEKKIASLKQRLTSDWSGWWADASGRLNSDIAKAAGRLAEDVSRMDIQLKLEVAAPAKVNAAGVGQLEMDISLRQWVGVLSDIGSYAFSGFAVGTAFPIIGNLAGALAGAAIGLVKVVVGLITSRVERIRRAQKQMRDQIDGLRLAATADLMAMDLQLERQVTQAVQERALDAIAALRNAVSRPGEVLAQQIAALVHIKRQIGEMPSGSIQEIRH